MNLLLKGTGIVCMIKYVVILMHMEKGRFKQVILETERLQLKELNRDIFYNLFESYSDDEIMYSLGLHTENELEQERKNFEEGLTTYRISFKQFLLVNKKTKRVIGRSGFHNWYVHHYRAEMGYKITEENCLRQGFMTEANRAIVDYGFREMDLHRIEALIGEDNIPSLKLLQGLGFKKEGVLREHYFINNRFEDSVIYGLLRQNYFDKK